VLYGLRAGSDEAAADPEQQASAVSAAAAIRAIRTTGVARAERARRDRAGVIACGIFGTPWIGARCIGAPAALD
jgi:hypothetical protein